MSNWDDESENWIFDPSLAAMNRSLEREIREEAEEVESIVAESELRERNFADVALEYRNRGEIVAVGTTHRTFNGMVVGAAGDFITVKTDSFEVDINLADVAYLKVIQRGRLGGRANEDAPGTFEMRLIERKSPYERVEVGFRQLKDTVTGHITVVGQDHAVIIDDNNGEWVTPISAISWVVRKGRRSLK